MISKVRRVFNGLALIGAVVYFVSCVPNKKIVLLQKKDLNDVAISRDTILRSYVIDTFHYKIQTNDVLSIRFESLTPKEFDFFTNPSAQQGMNVGGVNTLIVGELVDEEGMVPFPVVGKVKVSGLTVFQVQEKLQTMASQYIQSPIVKVRLINYRITLLGEVNVEGTITLSNNRVSMLEAIGLAGGLGELADRSAIKLIRQLGNKTEIQYINLLDENFFRSPYYYVYQNDVLIVPPLKQRPFRKYFGQNLTLVVSTLSLLILALNLTK